MSLRWRIAKAVATTFVWCQELQNRWPMIVSILRGHPTIYRAVIGRNGYFLTVSDVRGAHIQDVLIEGRGWVYTPEGGQRR